MNDDPNHMLKVLQLLEWNDSGAPSRILKDETRRVDEDDDDSSQKGSNIDCVEQMRHG